MSSEIDGVSFQVIGLDDLIINESATGRAQDEQDADSLERVRRRRDG